jgi:hypothetical protein
MTNNVSLTDLSDLELLTTVKTLVADERQATAQLIAALAELDVRRLSLGEGCSSLFAYCTQVLHLSEHAAYGRIEAARVARRFPIVSPSGPGSITLTTIGLLSAHLNPENHRDLLEQARHKRRREVELIMAALRPLPPVPSTIRKLPTTTTTPARQEITRPLGDVASSLPDMSAPPAAQPRQRPVVVPLTPEQYKVQFTVSRETHDKLRRAQDLLRHSIPDGDPGVIFDRALTLLLDSVVKSKLAASTRPASAPRVCAPRSRHIPAALKRRVWQRDGGRCAFVGRQGRCTERGFLEFHHIVPYAEGGDATIGNIQLRCRSHNSYEAERWFGVDTG